MGPRQVRGPCTRTASGSDGRGPALARGGDWRLAFLRLCTGAQGPACLDRTSPCAHPGSGGCGLHRAPCGRPVPGRPCPGEARAAFCPRVEGTEALCSHEFAEYLCFLQRKS